MADPVPGSGAAPGDFETGADREDQLLGMRVGIAPAQGNELKHVRRCLKPQKSDWAMLFAAWVAALTAMWAAFKNACVVTCISGVPTTEGTYPLWVFVPVLLAFGSALVSTMRFINARKPDDHLQAAQTDVDKLIALQAEAQEKVNREMTKRIVEDVGRQRGVDSDR